MQATKVYFYGKRISELKNKLILNQTIEYSEIFLCFVTAYSKYSRISKIARGSE